MFGVVVVLDLQQLFVVVSSGKFEERVSEDLESSGNFSDSIDRKRATDHGFANECRISFW